MPNYFAQLLFSYKIISFKNTHGFVTRDSHDAEVIIASLTEVIDSAMPKVVECKVYNTSLFACRWVWPFNFIERFTIHEKDTFMTSIVPMFFKQTKFRSFVSPSVLSSFVHTSNFSNVTLTLTWLRSFCLSTLLNRLASSISGVSPGSKMAGPTVGLGRTSTLSAVESKD